MWGWKNCFEFLFHVLFVCSQANSYGHVRTVSLPDHTFSWANLNKRLTSTVHIISLVIDNNPLKWFSGREENGRRNYFMVNLHASMGNIAFKYPPTVEEINQTTTLNQPFQIEFTVLPAKSDSESNLRDRIKMASSNVRCTVQVDV